MITFKDSTVTVGGRTWKTEYPVQDAVLIGNLAIILYKPESFQGAGQFNNLVALDSDGSVVWRADLPTNYGMDAYYAIVSKDPLVVDSYTSCRCVVDAVTGKIIDRRFSK